jgi:predicted esterase
VDQEVKAGVNVERIVLVGFDQGGAVSLAALLKSKLAFAGVVGMGTYLPLREEHRNFSKSVGDGGLKTPVLLCHGEEDHYIR